MSAVPHIHIQAADLSGFMAAAYLVHKFPDWSFTLEDLRQNGQLVGAAHHRVAHPDIRRFNRTIGLPEGLFIKACRAAMYLGDRVSVEHKMAFTLSFGDIGTPIEGQGYFDVQKAQDALDQRETHCFQMQLIDQNKFLPPDAKGRPVLSDFDYGYQMDPDLYANLLLGFALDKGVTLSTQSDADLIIDATGPPRDGYAQSWLDYGFSGCDLSQAETVHLAARNPADVLPLAAHVTYTAKGVTQSSQDQITTCRIDNRASGTSICGHNDAPWRDGTLRLGLAQACVEPLLGSALRSIILDLEKLARLMPADFGSPSEPIEYNRQTDEMYQRIRDFQSLPYAVAGVSKMSETIKEKLELFSARGRVLVLDQDDLFKDQWISMMLGLGITPRRASRLAQAVTRENAQAKLVPLQAFIDRVVPTLPTHAEFIARHCAAPGFQYRPSL